MRELKIVAFTDALSQGLNLKCLVSRELLTQLLQFIYDFLCTYLHECTRVLLTASPSIVIDDLLQAKTSGPESNALRRTSPSASTYGHCTDGESAILQLRYSDILGYTMNGTVFLSLLQIKTLGESSLCRYDDQYILSGRTGRAGSRRSLGSPPLTTNRLWIVEPKLSSTSS